MFDLPPELVAKPLALIALTGLDISNTVHRSIWDAFSNNRRPDSHPIQFKLLQQSHVFPVSKQKKNSYEWYTPKGILKRNWMTKYLNEIPSVVVFFYDLDWNDPQWNEKKIDCSSKVQSLRSSLDGRNTKIAVVLIQKSSSVSSSPTDNEDTLTSDRATSLCTSCELQGKLLYILPHGDHLMGYITRLENAFYDLSQNYYHHEYRIVKNHRDQLNKNSHQYIIIRHQYKMAFYNELKNDKSISLRHYQQCYKDLNDIRIIDTNIYEIKLITSFVNYKICKLMFLLNQPRDAISQFRCHTERYRNLIGNDNIIFEHYGWMTNQYSTFAELFDDAIRQGLPAVQTQHPGYYYQLAAHYATLRQKSINNIIINDDDNNADDNNIEDDDNKIEYYGQRSFIKFEQKNNNLNNMTIKLLQLREKKINHSMIIIGLLGNAISQFKIYRCPRMRRLLVVQMASEYFNVKDYGKVLTLLMHMLWDFRSECWPILLTDILKNALKAAFLSVSIQEYLTLCIEALGPKILLNKQHKLIIRNNIYNILKKTIPIEEPDLPDDDKLISINKWNNEINNIDKLAFTIDDMNIINFIQLKIKFTSNKFYIGQFINIELFIRNLYDDNIEFSKISISIKLPGKNIELFIDENSNDNGNFKFNNNEIKKFNCQFDTPNFNDGTEIQINNVSLYFGNDKNFSIIMKYTSLFGDCTLLERTYSEIQQLRGTYFDKIKSVIVAEIKHEDKNFKLDIDAKVPALLSEWMPIKILISSNQDISNVIIQVKQILAENSNDPAVELSLTTDNKKLHENNQNSIIINIDNENINDKKIEKIIFVRCHQIGIRNFIFRVEYQGNNDDIKRNKELSYSLKIVKPFDVTTQFYTKLFEPLTKAFVNEQFIMMPHIVCTSPWPLKIIDSSVELATDAFCIVPKIGSEQPTSTGVYTIKWQRNNNNNDINDIIETSTSVTLAPLWVEDVVVGIDANIPAHGFVRTPLCITYIIKNHSDLLFTLRLTMEASDAFMFAGQKQIDICIRPKNKKKIDWILRPLVAGFVALPTLSLAVPIDEEHKVNKVRLAEVMERSLPTHIYIMPKSQVVEA
ncbi:trafficking protein particle complex subunit 11 isoform X2 [Aphidius gifuensis]|uniref:trafficking protein particle complex subunit 11 isoform X2 n=1 Tax=Aphidius gifuensis TaxID=684658 RepID=UPI001CDC992E|nr:trafficking protein particle complex subunit 11 isoform X2 [Aphidius gifuensis]